MSKPSDPDSEPSPDSGNDWVTVATFSWLQEALIVQGLLQSEGLETFLPEGFIGSSGFVAAMQIRVQVRQRDAAQAREIIAGFEKPVAEDCPDCGSPRIQEIVPVKKNWLRFLLGLWAGVPMRAHRASKRCHACGRDL